MKRIYVVGPYSADNVLGVLDNMRKGMQASDELFSLGYAPFVPWFDYHFALMSEHPHKDYYERSMAWLEVADCVVMLDGWVHSKGCCKEVDRAKELGIPYYWIHDFREAHRRGTIIWREA